jgi:di/tricarboxylate transporter
MTRTRRIIIFIVLAFVLYSIVTSPDKSAGMVQQAFTWLADAVDNIFQFFGALLR